MWAFFLPDLLPKSQMVCYFTMAASMRNMTSSPWKSSMNRYSLPSLQVKCFFIYLFFTIDLFFKFHSIFCILNVFQYFISLTVFQVRPKPQFHRTSWEVSVTVSGTWWRCITTTRYDLFSVQKNNKYKWFGQRYTLTRVLYIT